MARPRLVHEGSPIIDDSDSGLHSSAAATPWDDGARANENDSRPPNGLAGFARAADDAARDATSRASSKPFKLQTRLVVGGRSDDGEDVDMMDEDDHDYDQRGSAGHQNHHGDYGHHGQQHQHMNMAHYQQQQTQSTDNEFFNNDHGFQSSNPIHYAPPPPPPLDARSPLVVLDAANIAYNYAESLRPCLRGGSERRLQPDPRGIRLAIDHFVRSGCRVQAVVPTSWYRLKPRPADRHHLNNGGRGDSDARMVTEEVEELRDLRRRGFLTACPPGDDDDAYAMALARREDDRAVERRGMMPPEDEPMVMEEEDDDRHRLPKEVWGGWVVSNDFFQDAVGRDGKKHQHLPLNARPVSLKSWLARKRISYSFANVGTSGVDGEIRLEFLPNPRNDLIEAIDACNRFNCGSS